jgi:Cu/Ag efflux protein CusF
MGILGMVVSLMFVSGVMAQEKAATAKPAPAQAMKLEKFHGVVENVDMAKKDVAVQYHKDRMSFSVGDKTQLFEGRKELKFSDLNKGLWASVQYQKEGN